jgi:hypothetical protein
MSAFRPKRVSGADLAAQLSGATANLPPAVPVPSSTRIASESSPQRPLPVVQINFKASETLADLIAREAEKAGSTRRFLARLLRDAGFDVPEADVNPSDNRRRRSG